MRGWIVRIGLLLWCTSGGAVQADDYKPDNLRHVDIITKEIIYDPISRKIYASVPGEAGPGGNSVVPIDPFTGEVGIPIPVGKQPNHLAVSDDGKRLYVTLEEGAVRTIDLVTRKPGKIFEVNGIEKILVVPGRHDLLAVYGSGVGAPGQALAFYDKGILQPADPAAYGFVFGFGSPLYAFQYYPSLTPYTHPGNGPTLGMEVGALLENVSILGDSNGRIYTNRGGVIDPEAPHILALLPGPGADGQYIPTPLPDPTVNRIFFLNSLATRNFRGWRITSDDYTTFVALDKMDLPGVGDADNLIRWGADGLAFRTGKQVFFLRSPMVGKPVTPADLSVTVTRAAVLPDLSIPCKVVVVNNGPGTATGVVLTLHLPKGLNEISAESTQGKGTTIAGLVFVDVGDLAVAGQCSLTVIARPTREGEYVMTAVVRSNVWDNQPQNNMAEYVIRNLSPIAKPR